MPQGCRSWCGYIGVALDSQRPLAVEIEAGAFFLIGERYYMGGDPRYAPAAANDG